MDINMVWLVTSPLPDNIEEIINNICDLVEEEETR